MKKRVLMGLVLLAIIGTSAVFAQTPTPDKLKWGSVSNDKRSSTGKIQLAQKANNDISGALVIPGTYNGNPVKASGFNYCDKITSVIFLDGVIEIGEFQVCKGLTSVTIPASVDRMQGNTFSSCNNLTSITFKGSDTTITDSGGMPVGTALGNLRAAYMAGGAGTYTRTAGGTDWTKEGGFSLSGTWTRSDGMKITIADNGQNITITGDKPNNGGKLNDTYAKR